MVAIRVRGRGKKTPARGAARTRPIASTAQPPPPLTPVSTEPRTIQPHLMDTVQKLSEELPALLDEALRRVKKGKPPTLLRALRGLIRDLQQMSPPDVDEDDCPFCKCDPVEQFVLGAFLDQMRQHRHRGEHQRQRGDFLELKTPQAPLDHVHHVPEAPDPDCPQCASAAAHPAPAPEKAPLPAQPAK